MDLGLSVGSGWGGGAVVDGVFWVVVVVFLCSAPCGFAVVADKGGAGVEAGAVVGLAVPASTAKEPAETKRDDIAG